MNKYYNYDFISLSRENIYFILAIVKNNEHIQNACERQLKKLGIIKSIYQRIDKCYNVAIDLNIKSGMADFLVRLSHKYIDNSEKGDMLFQKIERTTNENSYNRKYYREREREIQQFGYFLAKNKITNEFIDEMKLKILFREYLQIAREVQDSEARNKGVNQNEKTNKQQN